MICKNPKCKAVFTQKKWGRGCRKKIFCSNVCRLRYHNLKRYNRLKNNKEYKDYQRETFRKWRANNREHFNDLCREKNRLFRNKTYKIRKEKGLCPVCGGKRDDKRYFMCGKCRIMRRK